MSQEERDSLKEELKQDLSQGYYKMTQSKIIAIIGCTITACLSLFGSAMYVNTALTTHTIEIQQNKIDISKCDNQINRLWAQDASLQLQINQVKR